MPFARQDRLSSQVTAVPVAPNSNAVLPADDVAHVQPSNAHTHLQRDVASYDDAHQRPVGMDEKEAHRALPSQQAASVAVEPDSMHQQASSRRVEVDDASLHVLHSHHSNLLQKPDQPHVTDQGQSDHRLLASSQEPLKPLDKSVHHKHNKLWAQSCQGKSHQRLMLMTALHKTAHKQLKRQHKHAGKDQNSSREASPAKHS